MRGLHEIYLTGIGCEDMEWINVVLEKVL